MVHSIISKLSAIAFIVIILVVLPYGSAWPADYSKAVAKENKFNSSDLNEGNNTKESNDRSAFVKRSPKINEFDPPCHVEQERKFFPAPWISASYGYGRPLGHLYAKCSYKACSPKEIKACESSNKKKRIEFEYNAPESTWPSTDKKVTLSILVPDNCSCP